jgi:hypothetical protein
LQKVWFVRGRRVRDHSARPQKNPPSRYQGNLKDYINFSTQIKRVNRALNDEIMKSKLLNIIGGLVVIVVSFLITLWLTAPTPADLLAKHVMPDDASVRAAATLEGLSESPDVKGIIDGATRKDESTVTLSGWAADLGGLRVTVLVLVDGKTVMNERTTGPPRPDVVQALGLPATGALDVQFKGDALCSKGTTSRLVIVSEDKRFGLGNSINCP